MDANRLKREEECSAGPLEEDHHTGRAASMPSWSVRGFVPSPLFVLLVERGSIQRASIAGEEVVTSHPVSPSVRFSVIFFWFSSDLVAQGRPGLQRICRIYATPSCIVRTAANCKLKCILSKPAPYTDQQHYQPTIHE